MEEFDFELLKSDLLVQPAGKEGSQLFHRTVTQNTIWLQDVSKSDLQKIW